MRSNAFTAAVDAGRALVMLRAQRNRQEVARALAHSLSLADVMNMGRRGAKAKVMAQDKGNLGDLPMWRFSAANALE